MSHISSRSTESYKEALKATESIEPPSLGFLKSSDFPGALSHQVAVIKQHNVQIQLLVQIAEDIRGIRAELQTLKELQQSKAVQSQVVPDELITKLTNLSLGPSERPKETKGKILVFKDPIKIFREAKG